jgi:hypothetical protein
LRISGWQFNSSVASEPPDQIKPETTWLMRLTTMLTLSVEEWIGNAAAVLGGVWGAVTQRSKHSDYSRTAIYSHVQRVVEAVANEQATGVSYEA